MSGAPRPAARGDLVPSAILGLLGTRGPTSRADVARALDVSPATVTQLTRDLIARGLVMELEHAPSQGGRPGRLLGLVRSAGGVLGAKVTADHVAIVDVDLDGTVRSSTSHPFNPSAPDALDALGHILGSAVDDHAGHLLGIGVGIPGSVDSQASGIVEAPTLGWSDAHVGAVLRAALGVPVLVENDVNTLAVAERLYGTGREHGSYLVVTIGRGIGCGIVVDGAVYRGASGGAGEIGHVPMTLDGPLCGCGSRGCLEAHVGEDALLHAALERGVVGPRGTSAGLRQAADRGDAVALEIYREAGALLGRALAGIVHTVDPEVIVLLGEGIDAWQHWEPGFEPSFRGHLLPARRGIPFVIEPWAEDKWALGAAALVLATPFDATDTAGDQGRLVRERLHAGAGRTSNGPGR
ncbi:ROK family transcriptional regulator [Cellulomonas sp. KRMCY2]|uniref:ROK family transcriptional regulator n=1 Tax=Cellulomonas sp. KRMCY2 TaxID=1304865 RepID=UPI00045E8D5C|nr:ROK family transcriptional regulator [Cellulomonas sp. KRMCY2]